MTMSTWMTMRRLLLIRPPPLAGMIMGRRRRPRQMSGMASSAVPDADPRIIDVTQLSLDMRAQVRAYVHKYNNNNNESQSNYYPIKLMGILAGGPFRCDAESYSNCVAMTCQEDGIEYETCRIGGLLANDDPDPIQVRAAIEEANQRPDVHGILVYYPIFKHTSSNHLRGPYKNRLTGVYYKTHDDFLQDVVSPAKDLEGLCHGHKSRWMYRSHKKGRTTHINIDQIVYPCTALSVFSILKQQYQNFQGKTATIVNRSEILGRPLAVMLASQGAHVYSVDKDSILLFGPGGRSRRLTGGVTMEDCMLESEMIVSGVPCESFSLPCESINPGATVVNVSEYQNVCEDAILDIPDVRFVPKVGKVTVAALELNLVALHSLTASR